MGDLPISPCTEPDFLQIMRDLDAFWGRDSRESLHNRLFLSEFGDSAYVIRDGDTVAAYLFGLIGSAQPSTGYIYLIAVRDSHRGRGLASRLYQRFEAYARGKGCRQLKAVTSLGNTRSVLFHQNLGFTHREHSNYAGPGDEHHRVIFIKPI